MLCGGWIRPFPVQTSMAETRKRKRVSKNKKKNWRKHVDIGDVEEFLEEERQEERTGGPARDKPDEQLFFVDKGVAEEPVVKRRRQDKPLKCHANLYPDPSVKPVFIKQNIRNQNNLKKKSERVVAKLLSGTKSKKEETAAVHRKSARSQRWCAKAVKRQLPTVTYDLWETPDATEPGADEHFMKVTRKARVKPTVKSFERPSDLPAVEVIHPGASYNPSFEDHQDLLSKATEEELKKIKAENRIQRALDEMFPSRREAPNEESWLQEMSSGLFEDAARDKNPSVSEVENLDSISINPPVRRDKKKTERQRKKEKDRKKDEIKKMKEKEERVRNNEYFRLKGIKKEVRKQEEEKVKRAKRKVEKREKLKTKPKKLGKLKFEEPEVELKLSDELEGSLRLLKPEGHVLEDRFKSLQKRNIIEPRQRTNFRRRYKPKFFEKKGHKEVGI